MPKLKHTVLLLFLVLATLCCTSTSVIITPETVRETSDNIAVGEKIMLSLLAVRLNEGGPIIGSGVLVDVDGVPYMMTAFHVVARMIQENRTSKQTACHINVYTRQEDCVNIVLGEKFNGLARVNPGMDAALVPLSYWPRGAQPAEEVLPSHDFRIGEELFVVGCPTGAPAILTEGIVSGFANDERTRVFTDSDAWFGSSGGGVFLSTGEYVGYFHSMLAGRTPFGIEVTEGLNIFSPLPAGWRL